MPTATSPDGKLSLETSSSSEVSDGTPGMGHDMDDYFDVTSTVTVREVVSGRVVYTRTWSAGYDANGGNPAWVPNRFTFSDDSRAIVARWPDSSEERIAL